MDGGDAQGAIVLRGAALGQGSASMGSGWLRFRVVILLVGIVVALAYLAGLLMLPGGSPGRVTSAGHGLESLPLTAQGPVSAALGHDEPAYRVTALQAINPAQHLRAGFSRRDVMVASGRARLGMALSAYGYASALEPVGLVPPRASSNRVSYVHGALTEWYTNGPLGIEQGFDAAARPSAAAGPLTLSLGLSGNLSARLQHGSLLLTGRGAALRYGGLLATDARGRVLRSWLQLVKGHVLIRVDDRGAIYPLRIDPFIQQAELTASDGAAYEEFGTSVAVEGDTVVVGVPYHKVGSSEFQGVVYVFTMPASGWANATQTAELTASDGGRYLGYSVAISGNTIVAGAPDHEVGSNEYQGAVYVFTRPASGWASETDTSELTATDGARYDQLGWSVGISGDTVVAGAPNHKVGSNAEQGAAYVFVMPATGWPAGLTQTAELSASDGVVKDRLGESVGISGNTIVAGAPHHVAETFAEQGAAYVFVMPASGWANATQTAELTASDGERENYLGASVAISGNTIVAGAPDHAVDSHNLQGAAYVFVMPASGWTNMTQTAELTSSDGAFPDKFGTSVAISGNKVVAGAIEHTVGSNADQGAAYVFEMPASGWANMTQTDELTAADGAAKDLFGWSVAVSGNTVVAGAIEHEADSHPGQGAAYLFVVPVVIASPPDLSFGAQTTDQPGSVLWLPVQNAGQAPLSFSGAARITGPDAGDFTIPAGDELCEDKALEPGQDCWIGVQFTAAANGSRSATLSFGANNATTAAAAVSLTGTGVTANSGPAGANGTNGTNGAAGTTGPTGAKGARGSTGLKGARGSQGPPGEVELVTCKSHTKGTGKHRKIVQKCTTKLMSFPVTITTAGASIAAVLSRGKVLYATGSAIVSGKQIKLLLTPRRRIGKESYTLTLTHGPERRRETITID